MLLTSEGWISLGLVTLVVQVVDTLKTQMNYSSRCGSFVVGTCPNLVMHHFPPGNQTFSKNFPNVGILQLARPHTPLRLVKSGEIDLAFSAPPPPDDRSLEFQDFFKFDIVPMTPQGRPLLDHEKNGSEAPGSLVTEPLWLRTPIPPAGGAGAK